jgi:membrane protease YdiL (CAAX protease family)
MPNHDLRSTLRKVFWGPNGIRAGWRVLFFFALGTLFVFTISTGLEHFPLTAHILSRHVRGIMTTPFAVVIEIPPLLAVFLTTLLLARMERRPFGTYGLPLGNAFGKRFWQGAAWGLAFLSLEMIAMWALGGFSFGAIALSRLAILQYSLQWGFVSLLIGLAEEFQYRGYVQFALSSGIGFWPSAVLFSTLFGAGHLSNLGESWVGALNVFVTGLFWCFTLRRTGNLWFAVGMHAAGDFAETFLYSTPNSGLQATGVLLTSAAHGPRWLTGGTVGPEGSILSFILLGLSFLMFDRLFPARNVGENQTATLSESASPQAS